jgi:hypothetical protein
LPVQLAAAAAESLSAEDQEALKKFLIDQWKSAHGRAARKVGTATRITQAERIPVYRVELQALVEMRSSVLEPMVLPWTTEEGEFPESNDPPPDLGKVWDHPSEVPEAFLPRTGTYMVASTRKKKPCKECFERGTINCRQCFGEGTDACTACLGAGALQCHFCRGLGKVACIKCNGEGKFVSAQMTNRGLRCEACHGTGKFVCTRCKEGRVSCAVCNTTGKQPCVKCEGKKKASCPVCKGSGRLMSGLAFQSEFRPFHAVKNVSLKDGPPEALELALEQAESRGDLSLAPDGSVAEASQEAALPEPVKACAKSLSLQGDTHRVGNGHVVRRRILLKEGAVLRVEGLSDGQRFVYWFTPGRERCVAECDPFTGHAAAKTAAAKEAASHSDWAGAVKEAREAMAMGGENTDAASLVGRWRGRVALETAGAALLGALGACGVSAWSIFSSPTGLHRTGPAVQVAGGMLALGVAVGALLAPALFRVFDRRKRWGIIAGVVAAVFGAASTAAVGGLGWDLVKDADERAFQKEYNELFKYGVASVYNEKDIQRLNGLLVKYEKSRAALIHAQTEQARQVRLKVEYEKRVKTFASDVAAILRSRDIPYQKIQRLGKLINDNRLFVNDVSPAEKAIEELKKLPGAMVQNPVWERNRIRVTPAKGKGSAKNTSTKAKKPSKFKSAMKKWFGEKKALPLR